MKRFGNFVKWYLYITTGILIVCAVNFTLADAETIASDTLWKILFSGFLTTAVTVFLVPQEEDSKMKSYVKFFLHYFTLCIVMIICGVWFGWIHPCFSGVVAMAVDVAVVYLLAFLSYYIIDRKQAEEINQRLKEKYGEEE